MNSPPQSRRRVRALRLAALAGLGVLGAITVVRSALPALLESRTAHRLVEGLLESRTGLEVSLGTISYTGKGGVVLTGLSLGEAVRPQVQLPFVEMRFSVRGVTHRRVDEIVLSGPVLRVLPGKKERGKEEEKREAKAPGIPPVGRLRIVDGVVRIEGERSRVTVVGPISGEFARNRDGLIAIRGTAELPFLGRPLVFESALDPAKFSLTDAELGIEDIMISELSEKRSLRGTLDLHARLLSIGEGEAEIELRGKIRDLAGDWTGGKEKLLSGTLESRIKLEDSHRLIRGTGLLALAPAKEPGENYTVEASLHYDRDRRFLDVKGGAQLGNVPPLSFRGNLSEAGTAASRIEGVIKVPSFSSRHLRLLAAGKASPVPADLLPEGLELQGEGALEAELTFRPREGGGRALTAAIDLSVTKGGFASSDGRQAAEGIALEISAMADLSLPEPRGRYEVQGRAGNFEILVDRFYGDFRERSLIFSASGKIGERGHAVTAEKAALKLEGLGKLTFTGLLAGYDDTVGANGRLVVDAVSHSVIFDLFLRDTFGESLPWIAELEVDGRSRLDAEIAWRSGKGFAVKGDLEILDTDILSESIGLKWKGLNAALPLDLSSPGDAASVSPPRSGELRWEELSWGSLLLQRNLLRPVVRGNHLSLEEEITASLWGGEIRLREISFHDLPAASRGLRLEAQVHEVDFAQLSAAAGLPEIPGKVGGELTSLTFREGRLQTRGSLRTDLFGGRMTATAIFADGLWGPVPSFGLSLALEGIDLGRVTEALAFGRITGVVEGSVKDLVITAGQAEHFDARLETVKRKNVGQKISVEALEKISILGSGEQAGILSRGVYQFFEEYRYAKMGFAATLVNDHLTLTGVDQEGDRTYLVRGGLLPPRAEVITYSQDISYSEMVKRLKRVGRVGAEKPKVE